jgi:hypothetical protein
LILSNAVSTSLHNLFNPTTIITFFGPNTIAETLFPTPSIFTSSPDVVIAFVLEINISDVTAVS